MHEWCYPEIYLVVQICSKSIFWLAKDGWLGILLVSKGRIVNALENKNAYLCHLLKYFIKHLIV